jgi:hypothetical protein
MIIHSLKKQRATKKQILENLSHFNEGTPSLKLVHSEVDGKLEHKFIFNDDVIRDLEHIAICELGENIIIITNNYDLIDVVPKKIKLTLSQSFTCKPLFNMLNDRYILTNTSIFTLEEVHYKDDSTFIGYSINTLLTNTDTTYINN